METDWRTKTLLPLHSERPELCTVATVTGLSRDAIYDAAKNGTLPTIRVGRRLLVPVAKLRQLLGEDEQEAPPALDARRALADELSALADALRRRTEPVAS